MCALWGKQSLVSRVIVFVITLSFVLTSSSLGGYGKVWAANNFRPQAAAADGGRFGTIINDDELNGARQDGGLSVQALSDLRLVVGNKKIDSGIIALDWNIKKIKKTEDLERIIKSLDSIEYAFQGQGLNAEYLFGLTHRMRPKAGVFKEEESLKELVDHARKLLAQRGMVDVEIELLPYDLLLESNLDKAVQSIKQLKLKHAGKKIFFVFENIRFYTEEKSKDAAVRKAFEERIIQLTNRPADQLFYINEAFDKSHRGKEASMELMQIIPLENRAAGIALERDLNAVLRFLEKLTGKIVLVVGGAKFDKLENIAAIAEAKGKDLTVFFVGAQANAWRSYVQGLEVGASLMPSGDDIETAKEAFEKIQKSGAAVIVAEDFTIGIPKVVKFTIKDKQGKESEKEATIYEDIKEGVSEIPQGYAQLDVGPATIKKINDLAVSLKKGEGFIMNGGMGLFDYKGRGLPKPKEGEEEKEDPSIKAMRLEDERVQGILRKGTFTLIEIGKSVENKLGAGGDMFEALKAFAETTGINVLSMVDYTTGGGVVWAILAQGPKKLPPISGILKAPAATAAAATDGGTTFVDRPLYLVNNIDLGKGAETGSKNMWHALLEQADGIIINHSEMRGFYEKIVDSGLRNILAALRAADIDYKKEIESIDSDYKQKRSQTELDAKRQSWTSVQLDAALLALQESIDARKNTAGKQREIALKKAVLGLDAKGGLFGYLKTTASLNEKDLGIKIGDGAIDKPSKLVTDWDKVEIGKFKTWLEELIKNAGDERAQINGFSYGSEAALQEATLEMVTRRIVNKIMREILVQALEVKKSRPAFEIVLCHGENLQQFNDKRTAAVNKQDIQEMLEDINAADFIGAYEPRFAIGTGLVPSNEHIVTTQLLLKVAIIEKLGKEMPELYGGSLDASIARPIFSLPKQEVQVKLPGSTMPVTMMLRPVNGGLIGGAGLVVGKIEPVLKTGQELFDETGEIFYVYMNHKAYEPSTGLAQSVYEREFSELFKRIDLSKVRVAIGTPIPATVREMIQKPLDEWKQQIVLTAAKLRAKITDFQRYLRAETSLDDAKGGQVLEEMVKDLTAAQLSAEVIQDSRGRPTVRAILSTGMGVVGIGEAPAGESTGEREVPTVAPETAVNVIIPQIAKKLSESNLDLRKYEEVIRAHNIIKAMFGNDYKKLGGNTFTAVSWALFDLHAKLNNKELYQVIRDGNPWWRNIKKGEQVFYANLLNHGRHAAKKAGVMGIDFLEPQEIMYVSLTPRAKEIAIKLKARLLETDGVFRKLSELLESWKETGRIEDFFIGDEAGLTVKGMTNLEEAVNSIISSAAKLGLKAGEDYLIAFDIAATSFYNKQSGKYSFMGKERTAAEMIDYYVELVNKYRQKYGRNIFRSFEDPLQENDFENHARLTAKLEPLGVKTVGDDLYCTQKELLAKGLKTLVDGKLMRATSMILIKVNQVGNVLDAIDTIEFANENNIEFILSHRSGETLFRGIAHLFMAFQADALKSGAPQPSEFFPNEEQLVRRSKYLGAINVASKTIFNKKTSAAIVSTEKIAQVGARAVSRLDRLTDMQLVIAGPGASRYAEVLGLYGIKKKNILIAKNIHEAALKTSQAGFAAEKTGFWMTQKDYADASIWLEQKVYKSALEQRLSRNLVVGEGVSPAHEMGKLVQMIYNNNAADAEFLKLNEKMEKQIIEELPPAQRDMLVQLKQGTFLFPNDIQRRPLSEAKERELNTAEQTVSSFWNA